MGAILSSRRYNEEGEKVVVELLVKDQEVKHLKGEINDVRIFSENVADVPSRVSLRGKNEATKYFLIPRQLRKDLAIKGKVSCQRLDSEGKSIFIYVIDPLRQGNGSFLGSA